MCAIGFASLSFHAQSKRDNDDDSPFLVVDNAYVENVLAENWGWVVASGAVSLLLGLAAFGFPIFSTSVAYDTTVLTIALTAVANLIYAIKVDDGQKLKHLISGPLYGFLAYYMYTHPAQGLDVITLTIAGVLSAEGLYEAAVAVKNDGIKSRPWLFVSGIGSILAALWLTFNIPVSSLFVPGAALGTRLTSSGAGKVALGLAGKGIADERAL